MKEEKKKRWRMGCEEKEKTRKREKVEWVEGRVASGPPSIAIHGEEAFEVIRIGGIRQYFLDSIGRGRQEAQ